MANEEKFVGHTLMENLFKYFNLEEKFFIDINLLEENYQKMMLEVHPDILMTQDQSLSSTLNRKYAILKSDISRIEHILQLKNIDLSNEHISDNIFLMEQFELREELESLSKLEDYKEFLKFVKQKYKNTLQEIASFLDDNTRFETSERIISLYNRIKFLHSIKNDIKSHIAKAL